MEEILLVFHYIVIRDEKLTAIRLMRYLPNILTILRFPLTVLFIWGIFQSSVEMRVFATFCFMLSALTDLLDGILARRYNAITRLGAFLDPLADKFQVLSGFIVLLLRPDANWSYWEIYIIISVVVISARELGITFLRSYKEKQGRPLVTSMWGKAKTMTQMLTLIIALLIFLIIDLFAWSHPLLLAFVALGIIASAVLAAISAVVYMRS